MAIIVQKFGGSSVATTERIQQVASRVAKTAKEGNQVVVVVSAMGKSTKNLKELAAKISDNPDPRSLDLLLSTGEKVSISLLAMALSELGVEAIPMTAYHLGIETDDNYHRASVKVVKPEYVKQELDAGKVVVAAGFQGVSPDGHITTLGIGASDKTAVILAASLKADQCEIYTDVDGVYTSDPRVVPQARRLKSISCDEMLELATSGAKVMNSEAVEWAKKFDIKLVVKHAFEEGEGTMIQNYASMDDPAVVGAARSLNDSRVSLHKIKASGGGVDLLFRKIADEKINVDMILLSPNQGEFEVSFTVPSEQLEATKQVVESLKSALDYETYTLNDKVAKLSIVGVGMQNHHGVAARMFEALSKAGIAAEAVTTSEIKVSVIIDAKDADAGLNAVHAEFNLSESNSEADANE
jgi:aspartate kinase